MLYVVLFLLKIGWIADLIPDPVLKGFVEGAIWVTILKQVPALLGLEVDLPSRGFPAKLGAIARALPETHRATTLVAVASVAALWLLRRFAPRLPGPLVVLAASIVLMSGPRPGPDRGRRGGRGQRGRLGLRMDRPSPARPVVDLLPGALAIVVLGYTKSLGALKRAHAAEPGSKPIDPDRELLAIGTANLAAGLSGGYPVAGSWRPRRCGSTREARPRSETPSPAC